MVSPTLICVPVGVLNTAGAPAIGLKVPFVPVRRIWMPPVAAGSLNVTACPALIVTLRLLGTKLRAFMSTVALLAAPGDFPLAPAAGPQAATTNGINRRTAGKSFFMDAWPFTL